MLIQSKSRQEALKPFEVLARSPFFLDHEDPLRDTSIFFFRRGPKFGAWQIGFVRKSEPHLVLLSTNKGSSDKSIRAAYEDLRLAHETPSLRELDQIEFVFAWSSGTTEINYEEEQDSGQCNVPDAQKILECSEIAEEIPVDKVIRIR